MDVQASRVADTRYTNWVKDSLALLYTKECLEVIVDRRSAVFHGQLKAALGNKTCSCSSQDLVKQRNKWVVKNCPGVCQIWLDHIISHHCRRPLPKLATKNTYPSLWPSDVWEVMKLYQPFGCQGHHSAKNADIAALIDLMRNCDHFKPLITNNLHITEVMNIRNRTMHSNDFLVEHHDMSRDLQNMQDFLRSLVAVSGPSSLSVDECQATQEAISKIEELRTNILDLSLNRELELNALKTKQVVLETDMKTLEQTIIDTRADACTTSDLSSVVSVVQALRQRLDSQLSMIRDVENDMRAQQQSTSNVVDNLAQLKRDFGETQKQMSNLEITSQQLANSIATLYQRQQVTDTELHNQQQESRALAGQLGEHRTVITILNTQLGDHETRLQAQEIESKQARLQKEGITDADITALQQHLVDLYENDCKWENAVTGDEEEAISQMYVKPTIKIVRQRDQCEGLVEVQQRHREGESMTMSYRKMLYVDEQPCRNVYITGHAGMGKTTLCQKLAHTWCQSIQNNTDDGDDGDDDDDDDLNVLNEFRLLFYLRLKEVGSEYDIEGMIKKTVLHNTTTVHSVSDILRTQKCLIVLDGLDEWACPEGASICRGLNENIPGRNTMNKNCVYLTTSRNWKFDAIDLKSKDIDKHVEICGFSEKSSEEFAKQVIRKFSMKSQKARHVSDFFNEVQKKHLISLTYIPVLLTQLLTLWYFLKDLGKSQVHLYCKMLDLLFELARKRLPGKTGTETNTVRTESKLPRCFSREDNCNNHAHLILCLSKLAFESLLNKIKEESLVFKKSRLEICGIGALDIGLCLKSGILNQTKVLDNQTGRFKKFSFLHKKLQEFLAAVYLVTCGDVEDNLKQVRRYCDNLDNTLDMEQVFMFVCGMNVELGNQLLDHLRHVVNGDTRVQKSRQSILREDLIKHIQTCVIACVAEGASNELTYDVHLQDYLIDKDTISDYVRHIVKETDINIKSVYLFLNTPCDRKLEYEALNHLKDIHNLEKLWFQRSSSLSYSILTQVIQHNASTLKSLVLYDIDLRIESLFTGVLNCIPSLLGLGLGRGLLGIEKGQEKEIMERNFIPGAVRATHSQIEQLLSETTNHLSHLHLWLYCTEHAGKCRPEFALPAHTRLRTLNLGSMCVSGLHEVVHHVEKFYLRNVTVENNTMTQFIEALEQTTNSVNVEFLDVKVLENKESSLDMVAHIKSSDKFTVNHCDIKLDKTWYWVKLYKK